jgi:hypothetical protein
VTSYSCSSDCSSSLAHRDVGACRELQHSILEEEGLSFVFDVETDLGSVGVHDSSSGVQERSSQNDGQLLNTTYLYYPKSTETYELPTRTHMSSKITLV